MGSVKNLALDSRSLAVPAAANLKGKAEYFGPPGPPPLVSSVRRPAMRNDYVPDTPLEPADLPAVPGVPDNSLLDPNALPPPDTTPPELSPPDAAPPALEPPALEPAPTAPAEEKPALPAEEKP
jgi:hypothetical protein